jgi:thiol-disulfide isomerase/thioredoxin
LRYAFGMSRSPVAAVVALALLGCGHEAPPAPVVKEPPSSTPRVPDRTADAPSPVTPPPTASAAPPAPPPPPAPKVTLVELAPTQGDLGPLLRDEARRAKDKGLVPLVEFYADWCAPCRVLQENLRAPEIATALAGAYLVKLNLDDWHDKLKGTGFAPRTIPSFYVFGGDGRPTGKMLDGDRWGKSTPARMGEAIAAFLRGPARAP